MRYADDLKRTTGFWQVRAAKKRRQVSEAYVKSSIKQMKGKQ